MFKDLMQLNPHIPRYVQIEREGRLHMVVMRDLCPTTHCGKPKTIETIVGYSVHLIVKGHPHYRHLVVAEDDVHYLIPEYRGTGAHEDMRVFALQSLKDRGVQFVTARTKVGHSHEKALMRMGYTPLDMSYGLDLTKWTGAGTEPTHVDMFAEV